MNLLSTWTLRLILLVTLATSAAAADFDYALKPKQIAEDTWVLIGRNEDFTFANGGNIVNTAFVVTGAGVLVIDTGPSRLYGEQLGRAIAMITDEPIVKALNTHHHPDHFLGNQAFPPKALFALPETIKGITTDGRAFSENLYRLSGEAMLGTEVLVPAQSIKPGEFSIGTHRFEAFSLDGHTAADLAIYDHTTGVLFAGDLVFNGRTPTTPHARIARWLAALDQLDALAPRMVVPGHGKISEKVGSNIGAISQTRNYLRWLDTTLLSAAERGLDMTEVMNLPLPPEIRTLAVIEAEFRRSVGHYYPAAEQNALAHPHKH
jgi:uncharacterized sulfatase